MISQHVEQEVIGSPSPSSLCDYSSGFDDLRIVESTGAEQSVEEHCWYDQNRASNCQNNKPCHNLQKISELIFAYDSNSVN